MEENHDFMNRTWNWAILGCGRIAAKFAADLKLVPQARLYAAAARDPQRAAEFAQEHGFEKSFGSYEEMVRDPGVDVVYVATPHSHHHRHTLLCLDHGKAVLCEKAFALNAIQAGEMIARAREKGLFLMDAFWTRFQPAFLRVMEILQSGDLGRVRMMRSDFAFHGPYDPEKRLYNPELGGGSLLDIGIYPVFWALQALGKPARIRALAEMSATGIDESLSVIFQYPGGELASLQSSFACWSDTQTEFWCERGFLRIRRMGISTTHLTIWRDDQSREEIPFHYEQGLGYHLEAAHVMECLDQGLTESPLLPLSFTLDMMETLDRVSVGIGEGRN